MNCLFSHRYVWCLLVSFISLTLVACGGSDNPCNPGTYSNPTLTSLDIDSGIATDTSNPALFYTPLREVESGETVDVDNFFIGLTTQISYTISADPKKLRLTLFPQAHACSPYLPPLERFVEEISLTSDAEFSNAYPSGTSLNELIEVVYYDASQDRDIFLAFNDNPIMPLNDLVDFRPSLANGQFLQMKLSQTPESEKTHIFTLYLRLTDGEEFLYTLPPVTFN